MNRLVHWLVNRKTNGFESHVIGGVPGAATPAALIPEHLLNTTHINGGEGQAIERGNETAAC
jgi:hypothetical protein